MKKLEILTNKECEITSIQGFDYYDEISMVLLDILAKNRYIKILPNWSENVNEMVYESYMVHIRLNPFFKYLYNDIFQSSIYDIEYDKFNENVGHLFNCYINRIFSFIHGR